MTILEIIQLALVESHDNRIAGTHINNGEVLLDLETGEGYKIRIERYSNDRKIN